jgi:hypothetical protein
VEGANPPGVFRIRTRVEDRPVAGVDSVIAIPPPDLWVTVADGRVLRVELLGKMLRAACDQEAHTMGAVLHHADWYLTADPAFVEETGMHGDPSCVRCRMFMDQTLAWMAERPGEELFVGVLYWAGGGAGG